MPQNNLTPFDTNWKKGRWCYAFSNSGLIFLRCNFDPHRPFQKFAAASLTGRRGRSYIVRTARKRALPSTTR